MTPKARHLKITPKIREVKQVLEIVRVYNNFAARVNFYFSLMQLRKRAKQ